MLVRCPEENLLPLNRRLNRWSFALNWTLSFSFSFSNGSLIRQLWHISECVCGPVWRRHITFPVDVLLRFLFADKISTLQRLAHKEAKRRNKKRARKGGSSVNRNFFSNFAYTKAKWMFMSFRVCMFGVWKESVDKEGEGRENGPENGGSSWAEECEWVSACRIG